MTGVTNDNANICTQPRTEELDSGVDYKELFDVVGLCFLIELFCRVHT